MACLVTLTTLALHTGPKARRVVNATTSRANQASGAKRKATEHAAAEPRRSLHRGAKDRAVAKTVAVADVLEFWELDEYDMEADDVTLVGKQQKGWSLV